MPVAKKAILDCHAAAKELSSLADIAHYHAVGQACGTVLANGHAIGYPIYDLTSIVRKYGIENCKCHVLTSQPLVPCTLLSPSTFCAISVSMQCLCGIPPLLQSNTSSLQVWNSQS